MIDVVLPKIGLTVVEAEVGTWLRAVGDEVTEGEMLVEIHADKADVEVEAPGSGRLEAILAPEGSVVEVGSPIARIGSPGPAAPAPAPSTRAVPPDPRVGGSGPASRWIRTTESADPDHPAATRGRVRTSPRARRTATERGVDLASLTGTGPDGRIVARDVAAAPVAGRAAPRGVAAEPAAKAWPVLTPAADEPRPTPGPGRWGARQLRVDAGALDDAAVSWTAALTWAVAQAAWRSGLTPRRPAGVAIEVVAGAEDRRLVAGANDLTREAVQARLATPVAGSPDLVLHDLSSLGLHAGSVPDPAPLPLVTVGAPRREPVAVPTGNGWAIAVGATATVHIDWTGPTATAAVAAFLDELAALLGPRGR